MTVYLLDRAINFPNPKDAEPTGLVAIGGDLSVPRLLEAYKIGIFPWFNEGDPILWFSPNPRLVLFPNELHISKSLRKSINSGRFEIRFDSCFTDVICKCSKTKRKEQNDTWITNDMINAYSRLYEEGYSHSVETFMDGELVGGLYGVSLGGAFFGESMFHTVRDASKVALYYLVERLKEWDFDFIDSQVANIHMISLGARGIERDVFINLLQLTLNRETVKRNWNLLS